jgi:hypothetical protein
MKHDAELVQEDVQRHLKIIARYDEVICDKVSKQRFGELEHQIHQ